jgi:AcrR family transcriptional regulator
VKCITEKSEDKIKEAARRIFLKKGFDGTTSRDIAREADMNIALTNYYFRSKEKLFLEIFSEVLEMYFNSTIEILNKEIDIKQKISEMIEHDFEMMRDEPDMVIFIMNEIHKEPDRLFSGMTIFKKLQDTYFTKQLEEGIANGTIRNLSLQNLLPLIKCSVEFIFLAKPVHKKLYDLTDAQFEEFAQTQKEHIKEMICSYVVIS